MPAKEKDDLREKTTKEENSENNRVLNKRVLRIMRISPLLMSAFAPYATKTAYKNVTCSWGPRLDHFLKSTDTITYVDVLFRHGTRHPSKTQIGKWQDLAKQVVPHYVPHMHPKQSHELGILGYRELEQLGATWRKLAGRLEPVVVKSSSKSRTMASAEAFLGGYANITRELKHDGAVPGKVCPEGEKGSVKLDDGTGTIICDDRLLRFFDYDERYQKEVADNPATLAEQRRFEEGDLMQRIASDLGSKLKKTLSAADVVSLYSLTGSEIALFDTSSLQALWEKDQGEVLNYHTDLKHYYKNGPGIDISVLQATPYVNALIHRLSNHTPEGAHYSFGHAETLLPVLSLISPMKEGLKADNYHPHGPLRRRFDTSNLCPFAGNLGFIVYRNAEGRTQIILTLHGHVYGDPWHLEEFISYLKTLVESPFLPQEL